MVEPLIPIQSLHWKKHGEPVQFDYSSHILILPILFDYSLNWFTAFNRIGSRHRSRNIDSSNITAKKGFWRQYNR